jgi:hypothetical protein
MSDFAQMLQSIDAAAKVRVRAIIDANGVDGVPFPISSTVDIECPSKTCARVRRPLPPVSGP